MLLFQEDRRQFGATDTNVLSDYFNAVVDGAVTDFMRFGTRSLLLARNNIDLLRRRHKITVFYARRDVRGTFVQIFSRRSTVEDFGSLAGLRPLLSRQFICLLFLTTGWRRPQCGKYLSMSEYRLDSNQRFFFPEINFKNLSLENKCI